MSLKDLLNSLNSKFEEDVIIDSCKICSGFPDLFKLKYWIDNNQVIQFEIDFYCLDCLENIKK